MADEVDLANSLIDTELSRALERMRQHTAQHQNGVEVKECLECGETIPEARQKLGFKFCVSCAQESERRKALFADY